MENNLPPQKLSLPHLIKAATVQQATQNEDRLEPHILFLPHDVSRRMSEQLKKESTDIHAFVHQACVMHLNKADNERILLERYLAFSDLQLGEHTALANWAYNEEDEDIFKQPRLEEEEGE